MSNQAPAKPLVNYLRVHRKKAGLSQSELGKVLGYRDPESVAHHEHFRCLPPLLIALAYEVIFQEPLSEIFAGLRYTVKQNVEQNLAAFERELRAKKVRSVQIKIHAHKLEWLEGRQSESKRQAVRK